VLLKVGKRPTLLNEVLLQLALWLDSHQLSTDLHESYYMYSWVESTHVLTLMLFLGMLIIIDLRLLGFAFRDVPASVMIKRLDKPMLLGFFIMTVTGFLLFYAIPVRTTTSIWFRIKVVLLISAGINALLIRRMTQSSELTWDNDPVPPKRIRRGAGLSLGLWIGVIATGRMIAYDWWDCTRQMPYFMYWAAGCVNEMAAFE
jgi:hypothetical protein